MAYRALSILGQVDRITDRIYRAHIRFPGAGINCWLVREPDGLTVVDVPFSFHGSLLLKLVRELREPIRRVVVTHAHPDHAGALRQVVEATGAEAYAAAADIPFVSGQKSMADEPGWWVCRFCLRAIELLGFRVPPVRGVRPLVEGDRVGRLQVALTPGHTPGSLCLWDAEEGALFSGDTLFCVGTRLYRGVPIWTLDHAVRNASIRRLAEFPARLLLPGHLGIFRGDLQCALHHFLPRG